MTDLFGFDGVDALILAVRILVPLVAVFTLTPGLIWLERRGSAWIQNRSGPNRVGPFGLIQPVADAIKMVWKEDYVPKQVNAFFYVLAPAASVIIALLTFAVIPWAEPINIFGRHVVFQPADLNVGILYTLAIGSLGVYGIMLAGWSSNNKYSQMGGLRSSSQMISYELALGMSLVGILMTYSSVHLGDIVSMQGETLLSIAGHSIPKWGILTQPLGFLIFLTSMYAETNRLPFDLPEGESEIIAGYHLEYGAMKFAMFMLAEFVNMITASALIATLYFGGWQLLPGMNSILQLLSLDEAYNTILRSLFQIASFSIKTGFFLWLFVWIRWTLPRFRYDQLMNFGWKVLLPLSMVNILITGTLIYLKVL